MARGPGACLIQSAAMFEASVASLIGSMAQYLDEVMSRNPPNCVLREINTEICCIIENLRYLEESIVKKVEDGMDIHGRA